jgi:hypothetical protein
MKLGRTVIGCILQAHHKLPESPDDNETIDWGSPESLERLKKSSDEHDKARIVTIDITEAQAKAIVHRLWPGEGLMGATCGRGFLIESAEQASVVNEVLKPAVSINFNFEKHKWMLQTWPAVVDSE